MHTNRAVAGAIALEAPDDPPGTRGYDDVSFSGYAGRNDVQSETFQRSIARSFTNRRSGKAYFRESRMMIAALRFVGSSVLKRFGTRHAPLLQTPNVSKARGPFMSLNTHASCSTPLLTVQQHILQEQQKFPGATGEFSWLLSGITLASKAIQAKVSRAGLNDILGAQGDVNVQGEEQQKLDVYANNYLLHSLSFRDSVGVLASEENDDPIVMQRAGDTAKYAVLFDPLDGSSNIDVNTSVGTIFSILKKPDDVPDPAMNWVLQPGRNQVAAGYVLYGSSTMMVYTAGNGVHGFTLDPSIGAFVLSHENIRMPWQGKYYSVNEAYRDAFPKPYRDFFEDLRTGYGGTKYSSRYIGSLVADFHRTLLKGGVFAYPPTEAAPGGKLRLLYEVNPMAMIAKQAGGIALDGARNVLHAVPKHVHQRSPFIVGGGAELNLYCRHCSNSESSRARALH